MPPKTTNKAKQVKVSVVVSEITEKMKEMVRAELKDVPRKLRDTTIFKDVKELPAGRYYIGDHVHFHFDDKELEDKMYGGWNYDNKNFFQIHAPKGDVLLYHVGGDGNYYGNDFVFPVDSASLSVVNANLGDEAKTHKKFEDCKFQHKPKPQVFFETFTKPLLVFYQEQKFFTFKDEDDKLVLVKNVDDLEDALGEMTMKEENYFRKNKNDLFNAYCEYFNDNNNIALSLEELGKVFQQQIDN